MNLPMTPPTTAVASHPHTAQVIAFFETLRPEMLARLDAVYADDARFIDPFNDVSGLAGVRRVFEHMFETLDAPRFEIVSTLTEGEQCFLLWNFRFRRKGRPTTSLIHGSTHVRFAADGRIAWHRDYWDPARELYETVPLLGALMRWLRSRLSAGSSVESR